MRGERRAAGERGRAPGAVAAAAAGLLVAGCVSGGGPTAGRPALVPVAFESITGAPHPVFNRLVADLGREAEAQRVLIVSRNDPATYRVRGYLSAHTDAGHGRVAWVFDVFDAGKRRTLRVAGEEQVAAAGDVWGAVGDPVVARIAARGVAGLAEWLTGVAPADGAPEPAGTGGRALAALPGPAVGFVAEPPARSGDLP